MCFSSLVYELGIYNSFANCMMNNQTVNDFCLLLSLWVKLYRLMTKLRLLKKH